MSSQWWTRFCVFLLFFTLAILFVWPTFSGIDLEKSRFPIKQKINLGLDLQGGLYLVLGVDFQKLFKEILNKQSDILSSRVKEKGLKEIKVEMQGSTVDDLKLSVSYQLPEEKEKLIGLLKKEFTILRVAAEVGNGFLLTLLPEYKKDIHDKTVTQSIEVLRSRIDEFGVTEPIISSQGQDRLVVELPGVKEVDRAKELIGRTAKLEFKLVDEKSVSDTQLQEWIQKVEQEKKISYQEGEKFSEYVRLINESLKDKLPVGKEISFAKVRTTNQTEVRKAYLLQSNVSLTGADLQDAKVAFDPMDNRPFVDFSFNARGAKIFEKLTGENIGKSLAIVLDNVVHSAPKIQSKIPGGRGQISIAQANDPEGSLKEAKDLAIVLRAGALPAQLEFLEQRVIGPSLGQDSIHKGAMASILGCCFVFLFVIFYYRISGVIAVCSLLVNVLFVLALLVALEATLTLPGIAGIALTVGIAVDSNVVIYERIREELREGKRIVAAVEAGFNKAFRTILDANITNAIAAIVLMSCGTGPIKGFAVTLLIGIITTLFTSVFLCRLLFDLYLYFLSKKKQPVLSI